MGKAPVDFCTPSSISTCIKILNSELNILDFNSISRQESDKSTIVQLINVCYGLATKVKKNTDRLNKQYEELLRVQGALKNEMKEKDRMATLLANEAGKAEDLKNKLKLSDSQITSLNSQLKTMKQEVCQLQHALTIQKLRHEHESRRKDGTISALKSKLYQIYNNDSGLSNDRPKSSKSNRILSNNYDEIIDKYVCQLHDNLQIVLNENAKYRDALETIYNAISLEVVDCPDSTLVDLSGLPCQAMLKNIEANFNLLLEKFVSKESG